MMIHRQFANPNGILLQPKCAPDPLFPCEYTGERGRPCRWIYYFTRKVIDLKSPRSPSFMMHDIHDQLPRFIAHRYEGRWQQRSI